MTIGLICAIPQELEEAGIKARTELRSAPSGGIARVLTNLAEMYTHLGAAREELELARNAVSALATLEERPVPLGVTGSVVDNPIDSTFPCRDDGRITVAQFVAFLCQPQHREQKILPVRGVNPGGAKDHVPRAAGARAVTTDLGVHWIA